MKRGFISSLLLGSFLLWGLQGWEPVKAPLPPVAPPAVHVQQNAPAPESALPPAKVAASQATQRVRAAIALPKEVEQTVVLIQQGGPFPYSKDGVVFQNRERRLPERERGCYRNTPYLMPGSRDRGARAVLSQGAGQQACITTPQTTTATSTPLEFVMSFIR